MLKRILRKKMLRNFITLQINAVHEEHPQPQVDGLIFIGYLLAIQDTVGQDSYTNDLLSQAFRLAFGKGVD